mmetsp:Transcript_26850/g.67621  ORF Transcript_26850/g.67621 Transcript_26850/m.67621 type:complete len:137 (+) Transcript_26850:135-545(+)
MSSAASSIADQAAASARAAYGAYVRGEEKIKQAHDALLAATSAATMAQVSAHGAQEAATAAVALKQGYKNYPVVIPSAFQSSMEVPAKILVAGVGLGLGLGGDAQEGCDDSSEERSRGGANKASAVRAAAAAEKFL